MDPTPTAKIFASGYISPNVARKGIEPPTPYDLHFIPLPQTPSDELSRAVLIQSGRSVVAKPFPLWKFERVTFAPYGGSISSFCLMIYSAFAPSRVGGNQTLTLTVVSFLMTFPAFVVGGSPSTPVIVTDGLQVPFKYMLGKSSFEIGVTPSCMWKSVYSLSPTKAATVFASSKK